jgi:hypothetical protein
MDLSSSVVAQSDTLKERYINVKSIYYKYTKGENRTYKESKELRKSLVCILKYIPDKLHTYGFH